MENGIGNNLEILMDKMDNFVSSKTVVGEPVVVGEVTLIPLVDVSVGVGAGGANNGAGGGGLPPDLEPLVRGGQGPADVKNAGAGPFPLRRLSLFVSFVTLFDLFVSVLTRFFPGHSV